MSAQLSLFDIGSDMADQVDALSRLSYVLAYPNSGDPAVAVSLAEFRERRDMLLAAIRRLQFGGASSDFRPRGSHLRLVSSREF